MNLLEDIANILIKHKDKEHHIKVEVDDFEVRVYLEYDPSPEDYEDGHDTIPITYDVLEGFAFIPDDKYREMFKPNDYGIDNHEIKIINDIMEYLVGHGSEVEKLCNKFGLYRRYDDVKEENTKVTFGDVVIDKIKLKDESKNNEISNYLENIFGAGTFSYDESEDIND